jgi:hypothetical protein
MLLRFQKAVVRGNYDTGNQAVSMRLRFLTIREVQWPSVLYSRENTLAATLPIRAFHRIFTRRCRIASLISGCSEPFYLEAFDSTYQVFALLIPETELHAIKLAG